MASRNWGNPIASLDRQVKKLYGRVVFAAASISTQDCLGFSIARTGAGLYTVTLDDKYPASEASAAGVTTSPLLGFDVRLLAAAASTGTARVITDTVSTAKTFTISWDVASAAADPAAAAQWLVEITLRNTGAPRKGA